LGKKKKIFFRTYFPCFKGRNKHVYTPCVCVCVSVSARAASELGICGQEGGPGCHLIALQLRARTPLLVMHNLY